MMTGAFNQRVAIVAPGSQKDSAGQIVGAPITKLPSVPCSIETVTGGEVRRGQQMQATTNKLVRMRFVEGDKAPKTGDKLIGHGHAIGILAAYDKDGSRRELWVEGRSNG
jgi:hypothetical protein